MRMRYNYIFIPVLLIAGLLVWWLSTREQKEEKAKRISDRALVDAAKIDVIELVRPDQTTRMVKTGSGGEASADIWQMETPFKVDCNAELLPKLVDAIVKVESERDIRGVTSDQLKEYGLDNPELKIRLASKNGSVLMELALGKNNTADTDRYGVLESDKTTCFLIPSYFLKDIDLTASQLRDPHASAVDPALLASLQLSSAVADIGFENKDGNWYVTSPETFPASPARMDVLFHDIQDLQAKEFLPLTVSSPELAVNTVGVNWKLNDGTSGSLNLHGEDVKKGVYATSSHQPTAFLVDASIIDRLALDPGVFFHVLLIDIAPDKIQRVYIRQPGSENLEFDRADKEQDTWRILRPAGVTPQLKSEFNRLIRAMLALQPGKTIDPPAHAADYGFEPAYKIKIEVYAGGDKPASVIYIGLQDKNGDYYSTQDKQSYFLMSKALVETFISAVDKIRNAKPLEDKEPTE